MKNSKFLVFLSAFAFAIVGAFASMNNAVDPADLYAKVDGDCDLRCAITGEVDCTISGPYFNSQEECEENENPQNVQAFEPF